MNSEGGPLAAAHRVTENVNAASHEVRGAFQAAHHNSLESCPVASSVREDNCHSPQDCDELSDYVEGITYEDWLRTCGNVLPPLSGEGTEQGDETQVHDDAAEEHPSMIEETIDKDTEPISRSENGLELFCRAAKPGSSIFSSLSMPAAPRTISGLGIDSVFNMAELFGGNLPCIGEPQKAFDPAVELLKYITTSRHVLQSNKWQSGLRCRNVGYVILEPEDEIPVMTTFGPGEPKLTDFPDTDPEQYTFQTGEKDTLLDSLDVIDDEELAAFKAAGDSVSKVSKDLINDCPSSFVKDILQDTIHDEYFDAFYGTASELGGEYMNAPADVPEISGAEDLMTIGGEDYELDIDSPPEMLVEVTNDLTSTYAVQEELSEEEAIMEHEGITSETSFDHTLDDSDAVEEDQSAEGMIIEGEEILPETSLNPKPDQSDLTEGIQPSTEEATTGDEDVLPEMSSYITPGEFESVDDVVAETPVEEETVEREAVLRENFSNPTAAEASPMGNTLEELLAKSSVEKWVESVAEAVHDEQSAAIMEAGSNVEEGVERANEPLQAFTEARTASPATGVFSDEQHIELDRNSKPYDAFIHAAFIYDAHLRQQQAELLGAAESDGPLLSDVEIQWARFMLPENLKLWMDRSIGFQIKTDPRSPALMLDKEFYAAWAAFEEISSFEIEPEEQRKAMFNEKASENALAVERQSVEKDAVSPTTPSSLGSSAHFVTPEDDPLYGIIMPPRANPVSTPCPALLSNNDGNTILESQDMRNAPAPEDRSSLSPIRAEASAQTFFNCPICNKQYKYRSGLYKHRTTRRCRKNARSAVEQEHESGSIAVELSDAPENAVGGNEKFVTNNIHAHENSPFKGTQGQRFLDESSSAPQDLSTRPSPGEAFPLTTQAATKSSATEGTGSAEKVFQADNMAKKDQLKHKSLDSSHPEITNTSSAPAVAKSQKKGEHRSTQASTPTFPDKIATLKDKVSNPPTDFEQHNNSKGGQPSEMSNANIDDSEEHNLRYSTRKRLYSEKFDSSSSHKHSDPMESFEDLQQNPKTSRIEKSTKNLSGRSGSTSRSAALKAKKESAIICSFSDSELCRKIAHELEKKLNGEDPALLDLQIRPQFPMAEAEGGSTSEFRVTGPKNADLTTILRGTFPHLITTTSGDKLIFESANELNAEEAKDLMWKNADLGWYPVHPRKHRKNSEDDSESSEFESQSSVGSEYQEEVQHSRGAKRRRPNPKSAEEHTGLENPVAGDKKENKKNKKDG